MSRRIDLDRFLNTDPQDSGCDLAVELLHVYAELRPSTPRRPASDSPPSLPICTPAARVPRTWQRCWTRSAPALPPAD